MDKEQAIDLLDNLIGMIEDNQGNDYDTAFRMAIEALKAQLSHEGTTSDQPVATDIYVGDKISKFIDGLEEIFADLREKHVDDSVCGLCEYDGAYIGQSGDWCNECPGFDRDDCFKLSDKTRKKWTDEIIKALPTVQPDLDEWCTDCREYDKERHSCPRWNRVIRQTVEDMKAAQPEPQWIPCSERMPETGVEVLTYYGAFDYIEIQTLEDGRWENQRGDWQNLDDIDAWMPLPEPYRKGAAT